MLEDAAVEFPGHSADGFFVPDVRRAQAARGEAAEKFRRLDEDDGFAHALCLDGRRDATRGAAVDHDIVAFLRVGREGEGECDGEAGEEESNHGWVDHF
jgi:hypothetical protein